MQPRTRITRRWVTAAVLATLGVALVYGVAVFTPQGQAAENSGLRGADLVFRRATGAAADTLADATPVALVLGTLLAVLIALVRRRPALAVAAAGSIGLTTVATQVLKRWVLDRPPLVDADSSYISGSFPSGHTAAVISVVLALAMVVPARGRTAFLVVGGVVVVVVGNLTMAASWHRGSDVLGADLVALASASLACAWLSRREQVARAPEKSRRRGTNRLLLVCSVVALISFAALAVQGIQYYPDDTKDIVAFVALQLLGVSTSTLAVLGFALACRGLDVGGSTGAAALRTRVA